MTYYSREDIGLRDPRPGPGRLERDQVIGIALHWPGTPNRYGTPAEVKAALRSWQRLHMDVNGWSDIAYQVAIDQDGNVYHLRGLRIQSAANGDTETNERYGAILLVLGIGENPSRAMLAAARRRIARHRDIFPRSRRIVGHKDIRPEPTACPGDKVMELLHDGEFYPRKRDKELASRTTALEDPVDDDKALDDLELSPAQVDRDLAENGDHGS